ncbi:MAG: helix-turn-helix domain-containing protein [Methanospirillum sp.]|uniref:helix-turn-helix domain-containing protein n=1 Tax=Methanospirillum sp. TaxID=45200 RepID=UPI00236DA03E|nr:helix-turn-helix domain-containing protein [Methanospirillum sp.]MDD1728637.1 helix-turn-helix domain-containing protein [Methanospirillum sp.]
MPLITTADAASILAVSRGTIRTLIKSGQLRAVRISSEYRIDEADLNRFIEVNKTGEPVPDEA